MNRTITRFLADPNWPTGQKIEFIPSLVVLAEPGLGSFSMGKAGARGCSFESRNKFGALATGVLNQPQFLLGNGRYVNGSGSTNGRIRGAILRDPDNLMDSSRQKFRCSLSDHCGTTLSTVRGLTLDESKRADFILPDHQTTKFLALVGNYHSGDGRVEHSLAVCHNHNGGGSFYGQSFAQISNDGRWVLFSSYWDGSLGASTNNDSGIRPASIPSLWSCTDRRRMKA